MGLSKFNIYNKIDKELLYHCTIGQSHDYNNVSSSVANGLDIEFFSLTRKVIASDFFFFTLEVLVGLGRIHIWPDTGYLDDF